MKYLILLLINSFLWAFIFWVKSPPVSTDHLIADPILFEAGITPIKPEINIEVGRVLLSKRDMLVDTRKTNIYLSEDKKLVYCLIWQFAEAVGKIKVLETNTPIIIQNVWTNKSNVLIWDYRLLPPKHYYLMEVRIGDKKAQLLISATNGSFDLEPITNRIKINGNSRLPTNADFDKAFTVDSSKQFIEPL